MSKDKKAEILKEYFIKRCGLDESEISNETSLFISGLLDSLDVLTLISFLEKTFSIKVRPYEVSLETFDTIDKLCHYIENEQKRDQ